MQNRLIENDFKAYTRKVPYLSKKNNIRTRADFARKQLIRKKLQKRVVVRRNKDKFVRIRWKLYV